MPALPPGFTARSFAHRGLHDRGAGRIENSRAACRAAIAAGFGIEIDLQLSADGEAMVFHDDDLDRLTPETGPVRARAAQALSHIPLKGGGETVPTLAEILDLVAGRVPLLIEIKDQDGALGPDIGPLEARTAELLRDYAGPVAVMSFNPHSIARMAQEAPRIPRGLVTEPMRAEHWPGIAPERLAALGRIADFDRVGASFVSHYFRALAIPPIAALKARGVPVLCWTVRSPAEAEEAWQIADAITFENFRPGH
ncbi:MAG: phosphodiesterase [Alphaproteobacteria bacterium]|nr:MAG: phosphodiesterase [Alphaproteobacteria bacterium]